MERDNKILGGIQGKTTKIHKETKSLRNGIKLSIELFAWGLIGAAVVLLCFTVLRYAPLRKSFHNTPVSTDWGSIQYCVDNHEGMLGRVWCYQISTGLILRDMIMICVMSGPIYLLLFRFKRSITILMVGIAIIFFAVENFITLNGNKSIQSLSFPVILCLATIPCLVLRSQEKVLFRSALFNYFTIVLGMILLKVHAYVSENKLLFAIFGLPIIKEVFFIPASIHVKMLAQHYQSHHDLRQSGIFIFALKAQLFIAIWCRMAISSITDQGELIVYVVVGSLVEILMRLTFRSRQEKLVSIIKTRKRGEILPQDKYTQTTPTAADTTDLWIANLVIGEMIAEHVATIVNVGIIVLFHDSVFLVPHAFFAEANDPLNIQITVQGMLGLYIPQLLGEFIVDGICIVHENKYLSLHDRWRAQTARSKLRLIVLSSAIAFSTSLMLLNLSVLSCRSQDDWSNFCTCSYTPSSIYGRACDQDIFNRTNSSQFST